MSSGKAKITVPFDYTPAIMENTINSGNGSEKKFRKGRAKKAMTSKLMKSLGKYLLSTITMIINSFSQINQ